MRPLSLHHTTVIDLPPPALVDVAAATGCQGVCVFVHSPNPLLSFPLVERGTLGAMRERLAATGQRVTNIEYVYVAPDTDVAALEAALALGAELGAARLVVHVHDDDFNRAVDNFAALCRLCADYGLAACIEFYGLARGCCDLPGTIALLTAADQTNSGAAIDCLHVIRTGATPADVAALDPKFLGYGQLCDGPCDRRREEWLDELKNGRMIPGEGELPLVDLVRAVPKSLPFDVEVPRNRPADLAIPAIERARRAVAGARRVLAEAQRD